MSYVSLGCIVWITFVGYIIEHSCCVSIGCQFVATVLGLLFPLFLPCLPIASPNCDAASLSPLWPFSSGLSLDSLYCNSQRHHQVSAQISWGIQIRLLPCKDCNHRCYFFNFSIPLGCPRRTDLNMVLHGPWVKVATIGSFRLACPWNRISISLQFCHDCRWASQRLKISTWSSRCSPLP